MFFLLFDWDAIIHCTILAKTAVLIWTSEFSVFFNSNFLRYQYLAGHHGMEHNKTPGYHRDIFCLPTFLKCVWKFTFFGFYFTFANSAKFKTLRIYKNCDFWSQKGIIELFTLSMQPPSNLLLFHNFYKFHFFTKIQVLTGKKTLFSCIFTS